MRDKTLVSAETCAKTPGLGIRTGRVSPGPSSGWAAVACRAAAAQGDGNLGGAAGISALLSQPDDVALRIGDQREAHPRRLPRFLHHGAAELGGLLDDAVDVIHADEERDQVRAALQRADRGVQRVGHTGVDEGVARHGALAGVGPAEQVAEELAGGVRVFRPDLRVDDGVSHGPSLGYRRWRPRWRSSTHTTNGRAPDRHQPRDTLYRWGDQRSPRWAAHREPARVAASAMRSASVGFCGTGNE